MAAERGSGQPSPLTSVLAKLSNSWSSTKLAKSSQPTSGKKGKSDTNLSKTQQKLSQSSAPSTPTMQRSDPTIGVDGCNISASRREKFKQMLEDEANVDLDALRNLCWSGIPKEYRPMAWKILLGYLPTNRERRTLITERKRREYLECIPQLIDVQEESRTDDEQTIYRQVQIDVPRTHPNIPLFQTATVQSCLVRVLYLWALRHPATGYVQGINDLVTPFFATFLAVHVEGDVETSDVSQVPKEVLDTVEADTYWCLTKLLDSVQDNYTFAQPGIQRMIFKLKELVQRIDAPLYEHLEQQGAQFIQFAFRWMNCLLMRELPLSMVVRMWDTYLAEGVEGFAAFHVYVCASFLLHWSKELQALEFQDLMLFIQHLPTSNWQEKDIAMILSQAYMYKTLYHNTHHLPSKG